MSDIEKRASRDEHDTSNASVDQPPRGVVGLYRNTLTQVVMLGFVCFMGPGLFNALNGLGGGGRVDQATSANGNVALYSTFAAGAFFSGSICNRLGPRLTLLIGTTGYSLYIGSYLATNLHDNAGWFIIFAGAILGLCAGLLWTAQGSLMLAYPTESNKGLYISVFWSIFNLGAVVGASVALGQNFHNTANSVGQGTYIGFLVLTLIGVAIPMLMADPKTMYRADGSKVTAPRQPSWKTEIMGLWIALRTDPSILLLFPMFLASNWFYTWQFNDYNGVLFNIRTRALNSLVYWVSQIFGSVAIGLLLDSGRLGRRLRAFLGWGVLFAMVFVVHIWGYFYQRDYTRPVPEDARMDFNDHGYAGKVWLYIFCGLLDAMWQTYSYWMMGAMSNDPAKLAIFTGFYKSIQSAGAAGIWRADAMEIPYMNIFVSTWGLLAGGLVIALPMLHFRVKDHTELADEALARMDESGHVQQVDQVLHTRKD
ncbi:MFS general substrate transporter [Rhizoctonia solani 123E]|uniref:MFS general substrate transporter n=1 Tax=Rhizoctonia solani 123E TaxID=1423351 RepID=A0A074SQ80_9AGAM|nr:MFS general substrate transporter [Rhizoctonia solani 123E]